MSVYYGARGPCTFRAVAVTSTTTKVSISSGMNAREYMMISNIGSEACYIGDSTVSSTSGYPIFPNGAYDFGKCMQSFNFYVASTGTATTTLGVFEF